MDGKVEVSILQWEKMRSELDALKEQNATLQDKKKEIKLIITEKNLGGHYKFNRWTNMNEYVPETHEVEKVVYTNLESVKVPLLAEAEAAVEEDLTSKTLEIKDLSGRIRTLKANHEEEFRNLEDKHREETEELVVSKKNKALEYHEELEKLEEEHTKEVESLTEEFEKKIQELQDIIDNKKRTTEEEDREKERLELYERVNNLLKLSQDMYDKLPWWKKGKNLKRPA